MFFLSSASSSSRAMACENKSVTRWTRLLSSALARNQFLFMSFVSPSRRKYSRFAFIQLGISHCSSTRRVALRRWKSFNQLIGFFFRLVKVGPAGDAISITKNTRDEWKMLMTLHNDWINEVKNWWKWLSLGGEMKLQLITLVNWRKLTVFIN